MLKVSSEMSAARRRGGRPLGSATRFPGVVNDARALGVSVSWLRQVLLGRGTSAPLLERYRRLKAENHPDQKPLPFAPQAQ